jgi:hypothetical protein
VLYLALEDTPRRMQARLRQVLNGAPTPGRLELKFDWPRLHEGGVGALRAWLERHPDARLIVVDVLKKVRPPERANAGVYGQDYDSVQPLVDLARERGVAILVVHHTRKAGASDVFDEISGSTGLTGAADTMLVLRRSRGRAGAELHITGRDVEERELALSWDPALGLWTVLGEAAEYCLTEERRAIRAALRAAGQALMPWEIAKVTGKSVDSTQKLLGKMTDAGEVRKVGYGRYECASGESGQSDQTGQSGHSCPAGPASGRPTQGRSGFGQSPWGGEVAEAVSSYSPRPVNSDHSDHSDRQRALFSRAGRRPTNSDHSDQSDHQVVSATGNGPLRASNLAHPKTIL